MNYELRPQSMQSIPKSKNILQNWFEKHKYLSGKYPSASTQMLWLRYFSFPAELKGSFKVGRS